MLVGAEIEREIGWDLTPEMESEFNAGPVLIAQKAQFRAGGGATSQNSNAAASTDQTTPTSDRTAPANANQTAAEANGEKITDVGAYASTPDKLVLAGKNAQFKNARVVRLVGPRTFTVASGGDEIYVMLDENSARGVGTQGKIVAGSNLNISGQLERLEAAQINNISDNRFRPLTDQERAFLKNTQIFLQANEVGSLE